MSISRRLPTIEPGLVNGLILAFLSALYLPVLAYWVHGWLYKSISTEHEYFSHGLIGLPFAAYLSWQERAKWRDLPNQTHPLGAVLLLLAAGLYLSNIADLVSFSFPVMLAGICLWLKGMPGLRLHAFPLVLVLLATPNELPYLIAPYTLPLQSFIAGTAGFILTQFGIDVTVEQIYLFSGGRIVEVAPYCAGLKMLFTTFYVSLMLLYWRGVLASRWITGLLLVSALIISVTGNIIRNTLLTWFHSSAQEQAFHILHDGWAGDLYSAITLVLLIPLLNWLEDLFLPAPSQPQPTAVTETAPEE